MRISAYTPGIYNTLQSQKNRNQSMQQNSCAASPSFQGWGTAAGGFGILAGAIAYFICAPNTNLESAFQRPESIRIALTQHCPAIARFPGLPALSKTWHNVSDIEAREEDARALTKANAACTTLTKAHDEALLPNNIKGRTHLDQVADGLTTEIKNGFEIVKRYGIPKGRK